MKKKFTRLDTFNVIVIIVFVLLSSRLIYIQILNGDYYRSLAEAKGEKQVLELAPRGEIIDRKGKKIATNVQSFNISYSKSGNKISDELENDALMHTIRIVDKNGDDKKLALDSFPIKVEGNSYVFTFNTSDEKLKAIMEKNFKKKFKINENYDTKATFDFFKEKFKITDDYISKKHITIDELQRIIGLRVAMKSIGYSQYRTVYIAKNIKRETAMAVLYNSNSLQGISCEVSPMRYYPNGEIGSAFIGYIGKIDDKKADEYSNLGYDISRELIGKLGLEKVLENNKDLNIRLRGEPGYKYINVDKFGRIIKQTATLDPIPGDTVVTTIDMDLQKVAEQSLDEAIKKIPYTNGKRGAAVVIDVKTGGVLSLASKPGYDPNLFAETGSISDTEMYKKIFALDKKNDPYDKMAAPMFNYATMGAGPPGSTFKPLTATAALEEGVITPTATFTCQGRYRGVPGFGGNCWIWNTHHGSHGPINIVTALQKSCNAFFFEMGRRVGYEKFSQWVWKFGLASNPVTGEKPKTGIEIDETPGDVSNPYKYKQTYIRGAMKDITEKLLGFKYGSYTLTKGTEEYKTIESMLMDGNYDENKLDYIGITNKYSKRYLKGKIKEFNSKSSSIGELLNTAIGQGSTLLTPTQMATYMATFANGGTRYKTHLVKAVLNPDGSVKKEIQPEVLSKVTLSSTTIDTIKKGMEKVTEDGGTASAAFAGFTIPTGGKTGSASVSPGQRKAGRRAYGWYIGFAPIDNPRIAVCVVIYDAEHGSFAAPVARSIYEQYFGLNKPTTPAQLNKTNVPNAKTGKNQNTNNVNINSTGGTVTD